MPLNLFVWRIETFGVGLLFERNVIIILRIGEEKMSNFLPSPNNLNYKSSLVERFFWNECQSSETMDFM